VERRKGKTPDGEVLTTDWLMPAVRDDDVAAAHPCAEQPCVHRMLAECPADQIVRLANAIGLLTALGKVLPPEPVDIWRREIRALRNATALWDAIAAEDAAALRRIVPQHQATKGKELVRLAREHLARKVAEKMAGTRFELAIAPDGEQDQFVIRYRPMRLIDAIWQRFAEEIAGTITCAKCAAPKCGRWFPRSAGRSDRRFCCHACQMRFRRTAAGNL